MRSASDVGSSLAAACRPSPPVDRHHQVGTSVCAACHLARVPPFSPSVRRRRGSQVGCGSSQVRTSPYSHYACAEIGTVLTQGALCSRTPTPIVSENERFLRLIDEMGMRHAGEESLCDVASQLTQVNVPTIAFCPRPQPAYKPHQ
jgi:hypothetical protein